MLKRSFAMASVALATVLLVSCTSNNSSVPGRGGLIAAEQVGVPVDPATLAANFTAMEKNADSEAAAQVISSDLDTYVKFLVDVLWVTAQQASRGNSYWVTPEKLTYMTKDAAGKAIQVTGAAFIPWQTIYKVKAPILMVQHGTQIYRDYAPSKFLYQMSKFFNDPSLALVWAETIIGYMYANAGYIVVLPDYPGMGGNTGYHPYMDASISHSVVDLATAIQNRLTSDTWKNWTVWNKQLFLTGFSEGGYATMQAAEEFQANGVPVTAVATLDGPYDLSTTMRQIMIANQSSASPYFLPYTLVSFENIKGDANYAYTSTMIAPYCTTLPPMMNGGSTSDQVTKAMPARSDGLYYPRDILTPAFLGLLSNNYTGDPVQDGPIVSDLAANDAYRGWLPTMPLRLFHCQTDDLVPVGNSKAALKAWIGQPNVTGIIDVTPLPLPSMPVHVGAALPAYLAGFQWLDTMRTN